MPVRKKAVDTSGFLGLRAEKNHHYPWLTVSFLSSMAPGPANISAQGQIVNI